MGAGTVGPCPDAREAALYILRSKTDIDIEPNIDKILKAEFKIKDSSRYELIVNPRETEDL